MEDFNECKFSTPISDKDFLIFKEYFKELIVNETINKFNKSFEKIEKDRRLYRFYLKHKIPNSKGSKTLTVIAMNPSTANENEPDPTIDNLEKYFKKNHEEYSDFELFNLFPIRVPDSDYLKYLLKDNYFEYEKRKNDEYVRKHISETKNDVLLAWGKDYNKDVKKKIWWNDLSKMKLFVGSLNNDNSPTTFSSRSYNNKMDKNRKLKEVIINRETQNIEYKK
jgi:hypothetical protein